MVIGKKTLETSCREIIHLQSDEFFNNTLEWIRARPDSTTKTSIDCDPLQLARAALISRLFDSFCTSSTRSSVECTEKVITSSNYVQTEENADGSSVSPSILAEGSAVGATIYGRSASHHDQQIAENLIVGNSKVSETIPSSSIGNRTEKKKRAQEQFSSTDSTQSTEGNLLGGKNAPDRSRPDLGGKKSENATGAVIATRCFHGIANDLAEFLSAHGNKKDNTDVADIASQCHNLIKDKYNWGTLLDILNTVLIERGVPKPLLSAANIKVFIESALKIIQQSTISTWQGHTNFECIWNKCCESDTFRNAAQKHSIEINEGRTRKTPPVTAAEDAEKRIKQTKEYAWHLYCLFRLHSGPSGRVVTFGKEKESLSTIEACIGLSIIALSPEVSTKEGKESDAGETQEAMPPIQGRSQEPDTNTGKNRLSIENEAIAALSMMVSGGSQESSPLDGQETNFAETATKDVLDVIGQAGAALGVRNSRSDLEECILNVGKIVAASVPQVKDSCDVESMVVTAEGSESNFRSKLDSILPNVLDNNKFADVAFSKQWHQNALMELTRSVDCSLNTEPDPETIHQRLISVPFVDEIRFFTTEHASMFRLHRRFPQSEIGAQNETKGQGQVTSEREEASELLSSLRFASGASDPMITDAIDLNEWTVSILELSRIRPSTRLLMYLDSSDDKGAKAKKKKPKYTGMAAEKVSEGWRDVIIPVLNRALERMKETSNDASSDFMDVTAITVTHDDGEMLCEGEVMCDEDEEARVSIVGRKICAAVVALYYQSLEKILFQETARLKSASHPRLIQSCSFHRGLLSCCYMCILKAVGASGKLLLSGPHRDLDLRSVLQVMECTPYTYLKVSESFIRSLNSDKNKGSARGIPINDLPLPRLLQQHLQQCEVIIMDSLLWEHGETFGKGGNIIEVVSELQRITAHGKGGESMWPPAILQPNLEEEFEDMEHTDSFKKRSRQDDDPEHFYISYLLRKLLKIAYYRIASLCTALEIPSSYPIATQIWVAFRYLLRNNIDLLYDRHLDQLLLCALYGVCKIMKYVPDLTFSKIIEKYTKIRGREIGERECQRIVRHIKLYADQDEDIDKPRKKKHGNVIHLYNHVFVPSLKNHLLQSKSLKNATSDLKKCMSQRRAPEARPNNCESIISMADRAVSHALGWHEPTMIPVGNGNLTLNVPRPGMPMPSRSKIRGRGADARTPKTRAFYSFGGAHAKDLELVNRMITQNGNNAPP